MGRLHVNKSVPKMEDIERKMSRDFQGWVNKGGQWKPTECKARVKVRCQLMITSSLVYIAKTYQINSWNCCDKCLDA